MPSSEPATDGSSVPLDLQIGKIQQNIRKNFPEIELSDSGEGVCFKS